MSDILTPSAAEPAKPITAKQIRVALRGTFAPPAWRIFDEVGNGTGRDLTNWLDCVAVGIWPSVGQELVGVEIKVSKADLKREIDNPAKTEAMMKYMDRFYLACPANIAGADDVPRTWGLINVWESRTRIVKKAPALTPQPLDRSLLAALLRRAGETDDGVVNAAVSKALAEQRANEEQRITARVESERRAMQARGKDAEQRLATVLQAAGIGEHEWVNCEQLGRVVGAVYRSGIFCSYSGLSSVAKSVERSASELKKALDEIDALARGAESAEAANVAGQQP